MSSYRIASRAYPTEYWAEHGGEIVATANELNNDKWSFRESRQLLSNGLRTRSYEATGGELRQVWVQGLAIFLLMTMLQTVTSWAGAYASGVNELAYTMSDWTFVPLAIATLLMAYSTRWPVMLLITTSILVGGATDSGGTIWLGVAVVVLTTFPIALFGDGRRVISPGVLLVAFVVLTASTATWLFGPGLLTPALLIGGLALARFDARLLAAATWYGLFVAVLMGVSAIVSNETLTIVSVLGLPVELVIATGALVVAGIFATIVVTSTRRLATRFIL